MARTVIRNGHTPPYWVEAQTAVKNPARVIGYSVVCKTEEEGRTYLRTFSISRIRSWQVALHLANTMRDDLNAGIEGTET
jgi:hypothetical protein